jgi:hypothetical protein
MRTAASGGPVTQSRGAFSISTPANRYKVLRLLTTRTSNASIAAAAAAADSTNNATMSIIRQWSTRQCLTRRKGKNPMAFPQYYTNNIHLTRCFTSITRPAALAASSSPFDPERAARRTQRSSPFAGGDSPAQNTPSTSSPTTPNRRRKGKKEFVPRKAAVELTEPARLFFKRLLSHPPRAEIIGILLNYDQSTTGEPRMVFSFSFVTADDIERLSLAHNGNAPPEGVSLEVVQEPVVIHGRVGRGGGGEGAAAATTTPETRTVPKSPAASKDDGLPKLYVSGNAFLKVLGARVDVDPKGDLAPILFDKAGNRMDPNA